MPVLLRNRLFGPYKNTLDAHSHQRQKNKGINLSRKQSLVGISKLFGCFFDSSFFQKTLFWQWCASISAAIGGRDSCF